MTLAWNLLFYIEDYMLKWGNTEVTAVKWGSTNVTVVKWGSTVVFPTNNGYDYNSNTFVSPIASGLNYYTNFSDSTTAVGTAVTSNRTSGTYPTSSRVIFLSRNQITAAQFNSYMQIRITARFIVYNAVDDSNLYTDATNLYFDSYNSNSGGFIHICIIKETPTNGYTGNSSNAYRWENVSGWVDPYQAEWYYNALDWCGQRSSQNYTAPQGADVVGTYTLTALNKTRLQGSIYFGIVMNLSVSSYAPKKGVYKRFRAEMRSIEFLTSVKY